MDFTLSEEQQAIADLANQIMGDRITMESLMELEAADGWFDRDTYAEIAKAGLVGIGIAEDVGGGGLGLVEAAQVLEAQGRNVAPLPLWSTVAGALAIDRFGSPEQRSRLSDVADGTTLVTVAIQEPLDDRLDHPTTRFSGGAVTGTKSAVEFAEESPTAVVTTDQGLAIVDLRGSGVTLVPGRSTRGQPVHEVQMDGASAELLEGSSASWLVDRATALLCATQVGVTARALEMTASYTSTREQFGRPIATFQAVTQRLADQYINVAGIRLTTYAAVWELSEGRDATQHLHIAKWYASQQAHAVAFATQHVHGGMGVSVDYPLHRYTLWNKHIECSLGAGTQQLREVGALLAAG